MRCEFMDVLDVDLHSYKIQPVYVMHNNFYIVYNNTTVMVSIIRYIITFVV